MTPEEHLKAAEQNINRDAETAIYHATMAVAMTLLQMDICGHGTRGFCKDCVLNSLRENQPWSVV